MGYVFEPGVLHDVARQAIARGRPVEELITIVVEELSKRYPGHISSTPSWLFNNAGGAMGSILVLHASLSEYVIIFGTAVGTEGHTGRFLADDYFIILDGEQWTCSAGELRRKVFRPGDMHHLPRGEVRQYRMPDACWALEYARGHIPTMLPFGLADTLTSTLDFRTLARTMWIYARLTVKELLQGKI
jgi:C-8 sterol isomerase